MWTTRSLILVTLVSLLSIHCSSGGILKPRKTTADRIREYNYPAESHFVKTSDNYILNVFRIPYSPKLNNRNAQKPAVLLMHGLNSNSDCYILNGVDNALAYNFADAGYDVWLGNARGNNYSKNNTKISSKKSAFWRFSWHEIGVTDMATTIDYILALNNQKALHYVGHSQGTTVFFVLGSTRPEYNKKIISAHMLAPSVFEGNNTDPFITDVGPKIGVPGPTANMLMDKEYPPFNSFFQRLIDTYCSKNHEAKELCGAFYPTDNPEMQSLNQTVIPLMLETHPGGSSTNQWMHYVQSFMSKQFRQFDFGASKNLAKYGKKEPPTYELNKISSDMYLYYGLADTAANPKDVHRLPPYLSNMKLFYEVPDPKFGHLDFLLSMKVKEMINDLVIANCNKYKFP